MVVPWTEGMRDATIDFLEQNWIVLFLIGTALTTAGIGLFSMVLSRFTRRYYAFSTGDVDVSVDEKVLEEYAQRFWQARFPGREISCLVRIKRKHLFMQAELPFIPEKEQKSFITEAQRDLQDQLQGLLGYSSDLRLTVSFGD